MLKRLTYNWTLKLTALVLSLALWSHVRGQVNPWEMASFKARLVSRAPRGFVLQNGDTMPRTVLVTVRGPRLTLRGLKGGAPANPLSTGEDATRLAAWQLRASLDFSNPRRGEQKIPIKAETGLEDIEIVGTKPGEITVTLDVAARKSVAVEPRFDLPRDWRVESVKLSTQVVEISGASRALARVATVRASIEAKSISAGAIKAEHAPLQALDKNGVVVAAVRLNPSEIQVRAKIAERLEEKDVPVKIRVVGTPARGYQLGDMEVEPSTISLRGPSRILDSIESLTATLDVDGAKDDISRRARLSAPKGAAFVASRRVRIRARIIDTKKQSTPRADGDSLTTPSTPSTLPAPATP